MPQSFTIAAAVLTPVHPGYERRRVQLAPNQSLPHGTILGEMGRTLIYRAYAAGNWDGSQVPKAILETDCATDSRGLIWLDSLAAPGGPLLEPVSFANVFVSGDFACEDLKGLDANAVKILGRIVSGSFEQGVLRIADGDPTDAADTNPTGF